MLLAADSFALSRNVPAWRLPAMSFRCLAHRIDSAGFAIAHCLPHSAVAYFGVRLTAYGNAVFLEFVGAYHAGASRNTRLEGPHGPWGAGRDALPPRASRNPSDLSLLGRFVATVSEREGFDANGDGVRVVGTRGISFKVAEVAPRGALNGSLAGG